MRRVSKTSCKNAYPKQNNSFLQELPEVIYNTCMGELKWFLLFLIALWVMWVVSGGAERLENKDKPFLEQPAPIESGRPYTLEELKQRTRP